jgi:spermidine/putrescine transport system permease protein
MWMNMMLRTYSWLTILESNGLLNIVLEFFGLGKIDILYTTPAVILGMVYDFIPFMILPIYSVLSKMDISLKEAAEDLGANPAIERVRLLAWPERPTIHSWPRM